MGQVTPFDLAVHKGNLHASFPTALLGTNPLLMGRGTCVTNLDSLSYMFALSSYYMGAMAGSDLGRFCCGRGSKHACQGAPVANPFQGFDAIRQTDPDLYGREEVLFLDGGVTYGDPVWPFITSTRKADVMYVVVAGQANASPESCIGPEDQPQLPATCPLDSQQNCQGFYQGCCNDCYGPQGLCCKSTW